MALREHGVHECCSVSWGRGEVFAAPGRSGAATVDFSLREAGRGYIIWSLRGCSVSVKSRGEPRSPYLGRPSSPDRSRHSKCCNRCDTGAIVCHTSHVA